MSETATATQKKASKKSRKYAVTHDGVEHLIVKVDGRYIYCKDGLKLRHFSRLLHEVTEK